MNTNPKKEMGKEILSARRLEIIGAVGDSLDTGRVSLYGCKQDGCSDKDIVWECLNAANKDGRVSLEEFRLAGFKDYQIEMVAMKALAMYRDAKRGE